MASIRRHARSPFWYVRRRDVDTGRWVEQSTGLRASASDETRKAQRIAQKASVEESQLGRLRNNPAFIVWVPEYLSTHWANRTGDTERRMTVAWHAIRTFLSVEGIIYPRQIRYAHGDAYLSWRQATPVHDRKVGHNTALLELKFMSQLLNEAVRREYTEANPLLRLGIARTPPKIKPEITDHELRILFTRCRQEPKWVERCILIGAHTGCRFNECQIEDKNVDLVNGNLTLIDSKRRESDPRKFFTVPLDPALRTIFEEMKRNRETITCQLSRDKNGRINRFIRECGIDASFHSLRVTFVTRCHRAGLSMPEAMRLVNHSSQLVHRVYSRLNVEDVRVARSKVQLPRVDPDTGAPKQRKSSARKTDNLAA